MPEEEENLLVADEEEFIPDEEGLEEDFAHEEEDIEDMEEVEEFDEEGYEDQPLRRRKSGPKYDEDSDDKEFWENENRELEEQERAKKIQEYWKENED